MYLCSETLTGWLFTGHAYSPVTSAHNLIHRCPEVSDHKILTFSSIIEIEVVENLSFSFFFNWHFPKDWLGKTLLKTSFKSDSRYYCSAC